MNDKSFVDRIKVDLTDTEEKEALKKIAGIDKELQDKTFKNVRQHDDLILHIRENAYGSRKIVQAQFKTLGCRMKKAGSCWNCNYGVCDKCLITPGQYIKAFKRELPNIDGNVLVLESLGSITDPKEFDRRIFDEIVEEAIENAKTDYILIETHVTQIPEDLVHRISTINNCKKQKNFSVLSLIFL